MKMKIIISILAFASCFGLSAFATSFLVENSAPLITFAAFYGKNKTQQKMLTLLQQDITNGENKLDNVLEIGGFGRTFTPAFVNAYSKAVDQYSNESGNFDDSNLPADFQAAWRQHMKAWRGYSAFLVEFKNSAEIKKMSRHEICEQLNTHDNEISQTWYKVLAIADEYDVDPFETRF